MFLVIVSVLIYLTRKMCALSTYTLMITISCYHRPFKYFKRSMAVTYNYSG